MKLLAAALTLIAALFCTSFAAAQTSNEAAVELMAWEQVAMRAEALIEAEQASTSALTSTRETLVSWRTRFQDAQTTGADRAASLTTRINALGTVPEGGSEAAEVAQLRRTLTAQLEEIEGPRLTAVEAFNRANGLISEIDEVISRRQTEAFLEVAPSPLNPLNWQPALATLSGVGVRIDNEIDSALVSQSTRSELTRRLPLTAALAIFTVVLLIRGRRWTTQATNWVQRRREHRGRIAFGFLTSLSQVLLPLGAIVLFVGAVVSVGIAGNTGQALLQGVVSLEACIYGTLWLVNRVSPPDDVLPPLFGFDLDTRRKLRRGGLIIGIMLGLGLLLARISDVSTFTPAVSAALNFPILLGLGIAFWRIGKAVQLALKAPSEEQTGPGFGLWLAGMTARGLRLLAFAGPLAAAAGLNNASSAVMVPVAVTLLAVGFLMALQWPIRDVYAWMRRIDIEASAEALVPVLLNFALIIAGLPLLALVWGLRPEQLGELYEGFSQGIAVGDSRITPRTILMVIAIFFLGYMATRLFQGALKSTVLPRTKLDTGARNAVTSFVGYTGIALAALIAINTGGIDLTALAVVFGALSVGIGFGLQNVVQNFVAGIILLIERPIGEGDWIEVGGQMGIVKSISVRSTIIETFDKTQVIVPNADFISGPVTNWTRGSLIGRAIVEVGVAYGADTRKVEQILREIARDTPGVAAWPEPGVDFMGFGASSLDFRVRAILRDVNNISSIKTEIRHRIAERFAEEGIEIPFPQQDLWLRNAAALPTTASDGHDESPSAEDPTPA